MRIDANAIRAAIAVRHGDAQEFLRRLVGTPSLPGQESAAVELAAAAFAPLGQVQRVAMTNALREDADYSDPVSGIEYTGRSNLRVVVQGRGEGRILLLNTHLDTVPPSPGQPDPYGGVVRDGGLFGRGACDAKGQVATIYLAMAALKDLGVRLAGDLRAHLVVEEEVGGNGTLAMVRAGEKADGCLVLEPTDGRILTSVRGAVWFRLTLRGKPGHSGQADRTVSALDLAIRAIEILRSYHRRLLDESRGDALFDKYPNPMPLTIGKLHAGNWPATAPGEAALEGVLGLLPNKTARQVMDEMAAALKKEGGSDLADRFDIHFMYRHDASVCPPEHPLVRELQAAVAATGRAAETGAMTASCDAWLYNNQSGIPTVVFGGGSLAVAHSDGEHIPLADLDAAAEALLGLVIRWCGVHDA